MRDENIDLERMFQSYRGACPDVEPSPGFMPALWKKIEARQSFWSVFGRSGKLATTVSAVLCLLLLALNLLAPSHPRMVAPTYADALMADHSAEKTDYTEAIRRVPRADAAIDRR